MKLRQIIAVLQHHAERMGPDADLVVMVASEDGLVADAADFEVLADPYLPSTVLLTGYGPALATDIGEAAAARVDARRAFVKGYVDDLLKLLGSSYDARGSH